MASRRWRLRGFAASTAALLGATAFAGSGCNDDGVASVECESTRTYFAQNVWRIMETKCMACHNPQGEARETKFILKGAAEAGFIDANLATIKEISSFERDGESLWLLKPTHSIAHEGGVQVEKGSDEYKAMLGLVVRLKNDQECQAIGADTFAGVDLAGDELTLRKAAIILAGRLPSELEIQRVREGGFAALELVLDEMMTEERFFDFVKGTYGDLFQTDFYLRNDAAGQIADTYPNAFWFDSDDAAKAMMQQYGLRSTEEVQRFTEQGIAREPLELIEHVVKNNLPFSEIITADYMMFSPFTAKSFGVEIDFEDASDPFEFQPGSLDYEGEYGFPHAGVLTSPMFLSRWPTTETNRNRARSRVFMLFFLGTDILKTAEQPVDQTAIKDLNPTRNAAECTVCHSSVDPIAGAFMAFDENGVWNEEAAWYPEMFPPGFGDRDLPGDQNAEGLQWLARQAAQDERFTLSVVYNLYRGLTGREPLIAPTDHEDPLYAARFDAFLAQANVFHEIGEKFKQSGMNAKTIVKELVMSPYFRGVNAVTMDPNELAKLEEVGLGRLLTPEILHNKIQAIFGVPWVGDGLDDPRLVHEPRDLSDRGDYQLFYGGVDFVDVNARITDPNGLMAAVGERMAMEMTCFAVPTDFSRAAEERKLFKTIDIDGITYDPKNLVPESGGLPVPQAVEGIKQTIVNLHFHILGEKLSIDHPEVNRTYQLFLETWREGAEKLEAEEISTELPGDCQVTTEFFSGEALPEEQHVTSDEKYAIRAWMAVMTYLISDYKFLYE